MADGGGGGRRWQDEVELGLRPRVLELMVDQHTASEKLHTLAANFEETAFKTAKSKHEYLTKISIKVRNLDQNQQVMQASADRQQQMQMMHQTQLAGSSVLAMQGVNCSTIATPRPVSMIASPSRPPSQLPNQHMAHPSAPNMQIEANQGQYNMMAMLDQTFNSQSAPVAPVTPGVQSSHQFMRSVAIQSQNQRPTVQLQPTNFARCYPASMAQLQGQPVVRPNVQQNHLLRQNASGICELQWEPAHLMLRNQHGFGINQQDMNMQRYQMFGANVAKMNISYPGGWNNQQNAGWTAGLQPPLTASQQEAPKKQTNMVSQPMILAQQQITVNQQTNVHWPSPQTSATMESAGEMDWREEIFQQIKSLKDAYFSDLMELNQTIAVQKITEEQLKSLPREKADSYNRRLSLTNATTGVLKFLQLQKSEMTETLRGQVPKCLNSIHKLLGFQGKMKAHNEEMNTGHQSMSCAREPQSINVTSDTSFTGGQSNQQKQQEQPADASIAQMRQNIVTTTPPARQKTHSKQLQGVAINSPGSLQPSLTNDDEVCGTPSPISKSGVVQVASPYDSPMSILHSPITKPGNVVAAASPCASVKSTLTSTIKKSGVLAAASPCSSVKSKLPSNLVKSGIEPVASPCDSLKSTPSKDGDNISPLLLHSNAAAAAVNDCHLVTPSTKLMVPASVGRAQRGDNQAKDQVHGEAETPVAKKPLDRLLDAVRSSSPAALRSAVNSMKSALIAMDSVPLPPWSGSSYKMKRVFDITTDGSTMTFERDASDSAFSGECNAKRQKTQNAKDALLDEIEAINRTLVDTVISIGGDNVTDGITSCNSGILIKLSYGAVSLVPSLKSLLATTGTQPLVMPVTLLVAADYPESSPVIFGDGGGDQPRTNFSCISGAVDAAFRRALRELPEPRSIKETARVWATCVRRAVTEFAQLRGGGTMCSSLNRWESCVGA